MALPSTSTYGNTLSELQAGTNADRAVAYSRQNAEDATSQARLEAFLRLQGQKYQTQAQQSALQADRAQRMAESIQQNSQFNTTEQNRLKLGEMDAKSRLDVAKATADARGIDPRALQTILDHNAEGEEKLSIARALSAQRKALLDEIKASGDDEFGFGSWNGPAYKPWKDTFGREPDAKSAAARLNALDIKAATAGFETDAIGGGYVIPKFTPLVPGGRGVLPSQPQETPPSPIPAVNEPALPFAGGQFRGVGGGASVGEPASVVPDPGSTNRFRWTPNGAVAY